MCIRDSCEPCAKAEKRAGASRRHRLVCRACGVTGVSACGRPRVCPEHPAARSGLARSPVNRGGKHLLPMPWLRIDLPVCSAPERKAMRAAGAFIPAAAPAGKPRCTLSITEFFEASRPPGLHSIKQPPAKPGAVLLAGKVPEFRTHSAPCRHCLPSAGERPPAARKWAH